MLQCYSVTIFSQRYSITMFLLPCSQHNCYKIWPYIGNDYGYTSLWPINYVSNMLQYVCKVLSYTKILWKLKQCVLFCITSISHLYTNIYIVYIAIQHSSQSPTFPIIVQVVLVYSYIVILIVVWWSLACCWHVILPGSLIRCPSSVWSTGACNTDKG